MDRRSGMTEASRNSRFELAHLLKAESIGSDYETPQGRFTGEISWVRIDIGKEAFSDPAGMEEALAGRS